MFINFTLWPSFHPVAVMVLTPVILPKSRGVEEATLCLVVPWRVEQNSFRAGPKTFMCPPPVFKNPARRSSFGCPQSRWTLHKAYSTGSSTTLDSAWRHARASSSLESPPLPHFHPAHVPLLVPRGAREVLQDAPGNALTHGVRHICAAFTWRTPRADPSSGARRVWPRQSFQHNCFVRRRPDISSSLAPRALPRRLC